MVKVTVNVPKGIDQFVKRLAALAAVTPQEWYELWIRKSYLAIVSNNFRIEDLDPAWMRQEYGVEY
jgi:hypothetical protein